MAFQPKFTPKSLPNPTRSSLSSGDRIEVPEIIQATLEDVRPSLITVGASGTGKTWAILQFLQARLNVLLVDLENKYQTLLRYQPNVVPLGAPVTAGGRKRPPTATEVYNRILGFIDRLGEGKYREHLGRPIDLIAVDGLMEVGLRIARHYKDNTPTSKSSGEKNTYAMYDAIGDRLIDVMNSLRTAAGAASAAYGFPPVGIYCTVGEEREVNKISGEVSYRALLPGNIGPKFLPYQFEAVVRLSVARDDSGLPVYVAHLVGDEKFYAKFPGGIYPQAELPNWNMVQVYRDLVEHYRTSGGTAGASGPAAPLVVGPWKAPEEPPDESNAS